MFERDLEGTSRVRAHLSHQAAELAKKVTQPTEQRDPRSQSAQRTREFVRSRTLFSVVNRSTAAEQMVAADSLLNLQRTHGNRHVQRVVGLARQTDGEADVAPSAVQRAIERARGGGQALDSTVQKQMGDAFNADFSGVRVHTGAEANTLNRSLNARAFTTGRDIFFRHGEYNPGSSSGRGLLAHELTHVMQQNPGRVQSTENGSIAFSTCSCLSGEKQQAAVQGKLTISHPGDVYEQEADRMARAYTHWEQGAERAHSPEAGVQRQTPEEEKKKEEMAVHGKAQDGALRRQPEEEKKEEGMLARLEVNAVQRQEGMEEPKEEM
jgi:hypothetical protein